MLGSLSLLLLAGAVATTRCGALGSLSTSHAAIATAEMIPAGPFVQPGDGRGAPPAPPAPTARGVPPAGRGLAPGGRGQAPPSLPAHCRVTAVLKPTSDSNINVELWMPVESWNGKFLAVGNGGFAGSIQGYGDLQTAPRLGYATAGTDTGHSAAAGPNG